MVSQCSNLTLLNLYLLFGAGSKHILLFDIWGCSWFGEHGWYVTKVRYWGPNCKFWTNTNSNFSEETPKERSSYTNCAPTIFCTTINNSDFCCRDHNHPFICIIHWLVGLKHCFDEWGAHTLRKALANNTVAVWWKLHIFWITGIFLIANISKVALFCFVYFLSLFILFSQEPFFGIGSDVISPRKIGTSLAENVEFGRQCLATVQIHGDNYLILCGNWENSFQIISLSDGKIVQSIRQHKDVVSCVAGNISY